MSKARVDPIPLSAMRPEWEATMARIPGKGLKGANAPVHVIGTLMHAPAALGAFLEYWVTSKERSTLSVREQELVILRMGALYKSEYVWRHHVVVAEEFGVSAGELDAVEAGSYGAFVPREEALLALTDEIVERRTITDDAWERFASRVSRETLLELVGLVAQYVLFAVTNNAFRTELEAPMLAVRGLR